MNAEFNTRTRVSSDLYGWPLLREDLMEQWSERLNTKL
jgi:hypothetical protein